MKKGDLFAVELFRDAGIDLHAPTDDQGETVLMWAAWNGQLEVAQFLVEHGAKINAQDNRGWTALMWAAEHSHVEVARFLVEHGADIHARTDRDRTVLSVLKATRRQQQEVRDFLTEIGTAE